jgi:diguanylate cyclase (GGDEF)-like protein
MSNLVHSVIDDLQTAADLCRNTVFVEDSVLNKEIFELFEKNLTIHNIPVVNQGDVVGLINRENFMRSMARRFHWELYANKRCTKMMDSAPVTVEADTPINRIADQLLSVQNSSRLSDGFVVKRGKKLVGTGLTSDVVAALLFSQKILSERLVSANLQLLELSITDPLTGLHNRRHFDEILPLELKRVHRESQLLGLVMLDIDHFKKLNDALGHQFGDDALKKVATTLKSLLHRPSDYCFRLGGEEFAVLCSTDSEHTLLCFAEKLLRDIQSLAIHHPLHPLGVVTLSAGIALSSGIESVHQIYELADLALYDAKHKGRNQVSISGQSAEQHFKKSSCHPPLI